MKHIIKIGTPIAILLAAVGAYAVMQQSAAKPSLQPTEPSLISAQYIEARSQTTTITVHSQGTVQPCLQTTLTAEVSGRIHRVAPAFHTGGVFKSGALLLEVDAQDYREMVTRAEAALASAQLTLATEQARAAQAERDWKALSSEQPSELALRRPQLAHAQAEVRAAQAEVSKARRELSKTRILAPYDLMISETHVDVEQYVQAGTSFARVFGTRAAEIRLPVTDEDLDRLGMSTRTAQPLRPNQMPVVRLSATISGHTHFWQGRVVRSEGLYDLETRLIHVVATVEDPYGFYSDKHPFALAMGMFVQARIEGQTLRDRVVLPSSALVDSDTVWIIRANNTLQQRKVCLTYVDARHLVIDDGVMPGERVYFNPVDVVADGMQVTPVPASENQETNQ
jgi:RND family efflux transporter MFP subunit